MMTHSASSPALPDAAPGRASRKAIYGRYSSDEGRHSTSREVQIETCLEVAKSRGWIVPPENIFFDEGISGASRSRPQLTALRRRIRAGEIDTVIVYRVDRLFRSTYDLLELVTREWEGRCTLISATEPIETETPAGRTYLGILAAYARAEREIITQRLLDGRLVRLREGRLSCPPPYGYQRDPERPGCWLPDPEEAPVVQRIFRELLAGVSLGEITRRLNRDGIPPRRARHWRICTVRSILRNPHYIGIHRRSSRRRTRVGDPLDIPEEYLEQQSLAARIYCAPVYDYYRGGVIEEIEMPETTLPRLVSREEFARAQEILDQKHREALAQWAPREDAADPSRRQGGLLSGIARCACGSSIRCVQGAYYQCTSVRDDACAYRSLVPAATVDALVENLLMDRLGTAAERSRRLGEEHRRLKDALTQLDGERRAQEERLAELHEALRELLVSAVTAGLGAEQLSETRRQLHREIEERERALREIADRRQETLRAQRRLAALQRRMTDIDRWSLLTLDERRELLAELITDRITVYRDPEPARAPAGDGSRPAPERRIHVAIPWLL